MSNRSIRFWTRAVLASAVCTAAQAAPEVQWNGLSGGLNIGVVRTCSHDQTGPNDTGWFKNAVQTASMWQAGDRGNADATGLAGLSLAWNKQSGSFVYGAQLGVNAMHTRLDASNTFTYHQTSSFYNPYDYTYRQSVKATGLYTLAARAGYAFGHSLLSGTAGLGVTRLSTRLYYHDYADDSSPYSASHQQTRTKVGWTVGLDYQYRLANGLSLKGEYTFINFGKTAFATMIQQDSDGAQGGDMNFSARVNMNMLLFGIEKQF